MHNFVFHNPTKVIFGHNAVEQCGNEARQLGRHVLVVHGQKFVEQTGLLEKVTNYLRDSGIKVSQWGGVSPNPTVTLVESGMAVARKNGADVILGLGGGSVIDTAKAIAAGMPAGHEIWKLFTGKKSLKTAMPVVAIPTIAGSGSEMNSGMVLTNSQRKQKFGYGHRLLFPRVALLDPKLTYTVSTQYTAYGAIDALCHILEFYLTHLERNSLVQAGYMEGLARAIVKNTEIALEAPDDYSARSSLLWASGLALNGLSSAGLGRVGFPMHLIEHTLSAHYGIAHGAGLAIVMPGWLKLNANLLNDRITTFVQRVLDLPPSGCKDANSAIAHLIHWLGHIGAPTSLAEINVARGEIEDLARATVPQAKVWRMRKYDEKRIAEVLLACEPAQS